MERGYDLLEVLRYLEPAELTYQEWLNVGMALEQEGYSVDIWDEWSRRDPGRYHPGECMKKWRSFHGAAHEPVTGGTIVQYAREQGWTPPYNPGHELDWEDTLSAEGVVIDKNWVEGQEIQEPSRWDPAGELIRYLETYTGSDNFISLSNPSPFDSHAAIFSTSVVFPSPGSP